LADLLDSNGLNWLVIESAAGLLGIFCQDPIAKRLDEPSARTAGAPTLGKHYDGWHTYDQ
jgi:hypothetical protein